jgi:hypothetical protein
MRIVASASLILALVAADAADAASKAKPRLKAFSSCKSLVAYARAGAERTDGGMGVVPQAVPAPPIMLTTPPIAPPSPTPMTDVGGVVPPTAAAPVNAGGEVGKAVPEFSGTNTQEADVDEPDVIKTDGRRIFAVTDGTLRVIDPATSTVTGTLKLDGNEHRLLLRGDRVLVIAGKGASPTLPPTAPPIAPTDAPLRSTTIVTEIDVSKAAPSVMRTMEVPGRFVDARQNGAVARLVIDSVPQPVAEPQEAKLSAFMGKTVLKSNLSGRTFRRNLAPCGAVTHPNQFSGLDLLAILTVDLDRGMYSLDRDGVIAGAQVVYGSSGSLYVATRRYVRALELGQDVPEGLRTEIHRFDVSDPTKTTYKASGSVPGFILNSYALSEFNGDLRVASTEQPPWNPAAPATTSSRVTVLRQAGNKLNQIGFAGGLGAGERIFGVRFMGERGYVVTFRQVDPLYTLDLSDPTAPKVLGELKIPGYSAYLHPIGADRLLGIGREGFSAKASLFDVSNMAAPREVATLLFPSSITSVESEPHAFLYWAPRKLAVLPLQAYQPAFTGAVGVRVEPGSLAEVGRIAHKVPERPENPPIERSLVIGDKLYSLSYLGLSTASVDTLAPLSFTAF